MNPASGEYHPDGPAGSVPPQPEAIDDGRWTPSRWLLAIALIYAAHVILLFAFGARKPIVPRPTANVPTLRYVQDAHEWFALNDPTLFALPHARDFVSAGRLQPFDLEQPSFRWAKSPGELSLPAAEPGTAFNVFMQTNRFAARDLQLKPPLINLASGAPTEPVLAQTSTLVVQGDITRRPLLNRVDVPSLPYNDVIVPSKVQVVVDAAGNVMSAVLLPSDNPVEAAGHFEDADRLALDLARATRFTPAPQLTVGRLIFNWHTVPMPDTNAPAH